MATGWRISTSIGTEEERQWNIEHSHDDDSSKPNASCLEAAEERLIDQEILVMNDLFVLVVLWDFVKFYDTLRYDVLLKECEAEKYGPERRQSP